MTAFGPHYPPNLQRAVDDAERLAEMFSLPELDARLHGAWAIGRAAEIEQFVEAVAEDWHCGKITENAAAHSIESYVGGLHGGLHERLRVAGAPRPRPGANADEPPTWT
jgi:hypothetical protein